ncbi:hypothetical protein AMJ49_05230 [Parcubacteria bacterium DG_74_2]|nr:MAG: hypothetical protein AMJ49_05230 [Parcubacteria bacterium DG_74_2]
MSRILLITRPKYDETTHYLFNWSQEIIELARKKSIQVLDLAKKRANRKELTSIISKKQPSFIFFNGHGSDDSISGEDGNVLIKIGKNEKLLKSKIIYALSCKSARKLGPQSIKTGAVAYLGYSDDFVFLYTPEKLSKPLNDELAALFLKPSNQLVRSLLKENSINDSFNRAKALFIKNIQGLLTSESSPYNYALPYLMWDLRHLTCLGDNESSF